MRGKRVAKRSLDLMGWAFEGPIPSERKYVALAMPHTSNWDGVLLLTITRSIGLSMRWMVKDAWVKGALGLPMMQMGAVPIDRSKNSNVVDQMIEAFREHDDFVLFIPPEGTRSRAEYWKSGFYHIALGAKVPVVPGYLDFARKRAGLGPAMTMTGNVKSDMDRIRAFYAEKNPIPFDPSKFGPIRLREEEQADGGRG
ncbi:MAG: 1-acyl-sn-glycerol-3-phosphate acyltransferase [Polyangiaceae bacterium]